MSPSYRSPTSGIVLPSTRGATQKLPLTTWFSRARTTSEPRRDTPATLTHLSPNDGLAGLVKTLCRYAVQIVHGRLRRVTQDAKGRSLAGLELGLLEAAGEIDGDGLPLAELVEGVGTGLAEAVAGRLHSSEGHLHLGADGGGVHVDDAELQL